MTSPRIRRLIDAVAAPGGNVLINERLQRHLGSSCGGLTLDVGCGPAPRLTDRDVVGLDICIQAVAAYGDKSVVASAVAMPFESHSFEAVFSIGLLHHLSDHDVRRTITEIVRVASPNAPIVLFDAVAASFKQPLAFAIRSLDRGRYIRTAADTIALLPASWKTEVFTYTLTGLVAISAKR